MSEAHAASNPEQQLEQGLRSLGLDVSPEARAGLLEFVDLLAKWNRSYNLTAIRDEGCVVSHHLLDSLALAPYLRTGRVLDVGSGGGFPGIPLAFAEPRLEMTLLDSSRKKTAFLRQAITQLRLRNCAVVCERVETWQADPAFDWIISRAFAELADFVRGAAHLLAPGGCLAAMKGAYPAEEIARLPAGFRVREVAPLEVPGLEAERHVVLVERA